MSNYKAIVAEIEDTKPIDKADNIHLAYVLGQSVVVAKNWGVGKVGVLFLSGTQLSDDYVKHNNLYRDSSKNLSPDRKGFFENNRKVRAQPFLGVRSEAFFAELSSLSFTGQVLDTLVVGQQFENLKDVPICNKFININKRSNNPVQKKKIILAPDFKEHLNTSQFMVDSGNIWEGDLISIQSKRHGTSFRCGHVQVIQPLGWLKSLVNKIAPVFTPKKSYEYVVGTRRVVLDQNKDKDKEGYHGKESYRFEVLEALKPCLSPNMIVYGEIVGYVNGKPIMPSHDIKALKDKKYLKKYGDKIEYSYNCKKNEEYGFHIYRITITNPATGAAIDFSQKNLISWCSAYGYDYAFDLVEPFKFDGDKEKLSELVVQLAERPDQLTEDYHDPSHINEGVIVRVDRPNNLEPMFLKHKSYAFKVMAGICEVPDEEELQDEE